MRYIAFLLFGGAAWGQTADSNSRVLEALLSEVQQLRMAIERSTLLGARTQIAMTKLQMQETRVSQLSRELTSLRDEAANAEAEKTRAAELLKRAEESRGYPEFNSSKAAAEDLESRIRQIKLAIEEAGAKQTRVAAREGEIASQYQAAQAEANDSRSRIAEMERALDQAIQQLVKPR
jgi:chromosome segregation ATPase